MAGGRRNPSSTRRTRRATVWMDEDEHAILEAAADGEELGLGAWLAVAGMRTATQAPPPESAAVAARREQTAELVGARAQLRNVGGLLNQIAAHLNAGGPPSAVHRRIQERMAQTLDAVDAMLTAASGGRR